MKKFKLLIKILVITLIVLGVIFAVMSTLGGSGEKMRATSESFLSEMIGEPVSVGTVNNVRFFPDVIFDFEGVRVDSTERNIEGLASADHFRIVVGFFDMSFDTQKIKDFEIRNLYLREDEWTDEALLIEAADIQLRPETGGAFLSIVGRYGERKVDEKIDLEIFGAATHAKYKVKDPQQVSAFFENIGLSQLADIQ